MSQSQIGKLYKFYLRKIWQKNRARIIFFTVLYAVIIRFLFPALLIWIGKKGFSWALEISPAGGENLNRIKEILEKSETNYELKKFLSSGLVALCFIFDIYNFNFFDFLGIFKAAANALSSISGSPVDIIINENDVRCSSWKTINEISWFSLYGFFMMYFYIFVIKESLFSSPLKDGEESTVLTLTPGVKRNEVVISKTLAFLTFFSLANLFLFVFPLIFWCLWIGFDVSFGKFLALALWSVIVEPVLLFSLIITPHIFVASWAPPLLKQIFTLFLSSLAYTLPRAIKGIYRLTEIEFLNEKVGEYFFKPEIFIAVSLVCGLSFLALYYRRYQKQDILNH